MVKPLRSSLHRCFRSRTDGYESSPRRDRAITKSHSVRDRLIVGLAVLGITIYLLACFPGTVGFSPSGRFFAYVVADLTRSEIGSAEPDDAGGKHPPLTRLIVVDRKLGTSRTMLAGRALALNPVFVDEETLIVSEWAQDGDEFHFLKVNLEQGQVATLARFDLRSIPVKDRDNIQPATGIIRSTFMGGRLVVSVPAVEGVRCIEVSLDTNRGWLLPVYGGLPRLSPDGKQLLAFALNDDGETLDFEKRREIDLSGIVAVDTLGLPLKSPTLDEPNLPNDASSESDAPDTRDYWIEHYDFEKDRRQRFHVSVPKKDGPSESGSVSFPELDVVGKRAFVPTKRGLLEIDLDSGERRTWFPDASVIVTSMSENLQELAVITHYPSGLRLERWQLSSGTRQVVVDKIDFDSFQYGISPGGDGFVFVLEDEDAPGAASIEIDLESGEPTTRVPTFEDGLSLIRGGLKLSETNALSGQILEQVIQQTLQHVSAQGKELEAAIEERKRK